MKIIKNGQQALKCIDALLAYNKAKFKIDKIKGKGMVFKDNPNARCSQWVSESDLIRLNIDIETLIDLESRGYVKRRYNKYFGYEYKRVR